MDTKTLPKEQALTIENFSLKLHIARRHVVDVERQLNNQKRGVAELETILTQFVKQAHIDAGLPESEWIIDIDCGAFVPRPVKTA